MGLWPQFQRADASSLSELFSYQMKYCDLEHSSALLQCENTMKFSLSMHAGKESHLKDDTIFAAILLLREQQSLVYGLVCILGLNAVFICKTKKILWASSSA